MTDKSIIQCLSHEIRLIFNKALTFKKSSTCLLMLCSLSFYSLGSESKPDWWVSSAPQKSSPALLLTVLFQTLKEVRIVTFSSSVLISFCDLKHIKSFFPSLVNHAQTIIPLILWGPDYHKCSWYLSIPIT